MILHCWREVTNKPYTNVFIKQPKNFHNIIYIIIIEHGRNRRTD